MAASRVRISVVTPMHNEELCIGEFHRRTAAVLDSLCPNWEIVAVSDGSTDRTNAILRDLSAADPRIRALLLSRNIGQWAATAAGLKESRGDYVIVMDADLQHEPEAIPLLLAEAERGFDLVSGSRGVRSESLLLRRIPSALANAAMRATTGCPVRDMGGFKCIRGEIARKMRLRAGQHRLLPALVWLMGGSVSEVIVNAPPRFAGKSHYGLSRSLDVLFDILMLWFESANKARPLYLFGRLALLAASAATVMMLGVLADKLLSGEAMTSRPWFYLALSLGMGAAGLMFLGFILELLSDALNRVADRDPYMVAVRLGGDRPATQPEHAIPAAPPVATVER